MFELEFNTDNAAFEDRPREEIARTLRSVCRYVQDEGADHGKILDVNGNTIGSWSWT